MKTITSKDACRAAMADDGTCLCYDNDKWKIYYYEDEGMPVARVSERVVMAMWRGGLLIPRMCPGWGIVLVSVNSNSQWIGTTMGEAKPFKGGQAMNIIKLAVCVFAFILILWIIFVMEWL